MTLAIANDTAAEAAHAIEAVFSGGDIFETCGLVVSFAPRAQRRAYASFFG